MADFSKPTILSDYNRVLDELRDSIASVAKMFDGTLDSNVPTGAKRYSSVSKRLEHWDGTAWQPLEIAGSAEGSVSGTALANDSVSAAKILLGNEQYLRGSSTSNTSVPILRVNKTNETEVNSGPGVGTIFTQNGVKKWFFSAAYDLVPYAADVLSIGSEAGRLKYVHARTLIGVDSIEDGYNGMTIGASAVNRATKLRGGGSAFLALYYAGGTSNRRFVPEFSNVVCGDSSSPWALVAASVLSGPKVANHATSNLEIDNTANDHYIVFRTGKTAPVAWQIYHGPSGALEPQKDLSYDLGGAGTRVRVAYIQTLSAVSTILGSGGDITLGTTTNHQVILRAGTSEWKWRLFGGDGSFVPDGAGVQDIGTLAKPVRRVYAKELAIPSGNPEVLVLGYYNVSASGIIPVAGATYNLGSQANAWKDIHASSLRCSLVTTAKVDCTEVGSIGATLSRFVQNGKERFAFYQGDSRPHISDVAIDPNTSNLNTVGYMICVINGVERRLRVYG